MLWKSLVLDCGGDRRCVVSSDNQMCIWFAEVHLKGSTMKVKIYDWFVSIPEQPYAAPELRYRVLSGMVEGHPRHHDGTFVQTSFIVSWDEKEEVVVTHSGTRYILGLVHEEYEARHPDAKQRLIESLIK